MEKLGTPQEKEARRPEINRVKELIKQDNLLTRGQKFQDGKESAVIRSFGMQGVETVDDLFNRTQAAGYDNSKAREALLTMSTAVYESMIESGDQKLMDAAIAGSYSIESVLPKEWAGGDQSDPDNGSKFASMVFQNFIDKFSNEDNKNKLFASLESLDYLKNNEQIGSKDFFERQVLEAAKTLGEIMPMGRSEIEARIKVINYIDSLGGGEDKSDGGIMEKIVEGMNILVSEAKKKKGAEKEFGFEAPRSSEKQLELARKLLDVLEDRGQKPGEIDASRTIEALELLYLNPKVDSKVKDEIDARKKLRFVAAVMGAANGTLNEQARSSVDTALGEMDSTSMHLNAENLRFLLRGESGLSKSIAKGWNLFQDINVGAGRDVVENGEVKHVGAYHDILVEIQSDEEFCRKEGMFDWNEQRKKSFIDAGVTRTMETKGYWEDAYDNYFTDNNSKRRSIVDKFLVKKIKKELHVSDYEAERGVKLAWDLVRGSQEEVVFNVALSGHHDLTELLLTLDNTRDLMTKGKPVGPLTAMDKVVSVAPTWLRFVSNRTVFGKLYAEDIDIDNLENPKTDEVFWYSAIVKRKIVDTVNFFRNEQVTEKNIDSNTLKSLSEKIGKIAKYPSVVLDENGKPIMSEEDKINGVDEKGRPLVGTKDKKIVEEKAKRLRYLYVAGLAQLAKNRLELGWSASLWRSKREMLLAKYNSDPDDSTKVVQFISEEDLNKIERKILGKRLGYDAYYLSQNVQVARNMAEGTSSFGLAKRDRDEKFDM